MHVGIVGSRRRNQIRDESMVMGIVRGLLDEFLGDVVFVSGGCGEGADAFIAKICKQYGLQLIEHLPRYREPGAPKPRWRFEATQQLYDRNTLVAADVDELYALVAPDRKGGTEDTIKKALKLGKKVWLVLEDGTIEEEKPKQPRLL